MHPTETRWNQMKIQEKLIDQKVLDKIEEDDLQRRS
jgi:hypothetical protein